MHFYSGIAESHSSRRKQTKNFFFIFSKDLILMKNQDTAGRERDFVMVSVCRKSA